MSELPPGFVLDSAPDTSLPPGFVLDDKGSASVGSDLAQAAMAAPGRAVAGIAGLPGDALRAGLQLLGDNLSPESRYGSESIRKSLGSNYEAQTAPGRIVQTSADFLPAVVGGPESLALKLGTRVAAPALASEAAGQLTQGTNAEPYARAAGALAGGVGGAALANRLLQPAKAAVPTAEELLKTGGDQFNAARKSGLVLKGDATDNIANDIKKNLLADGFHPDSQAPVFSAIDRLGSLGAENGGAVPINELEVIRKNLVNSKMSPDASVRAAAKQATDALVAKQAGLTAADVVAGDAPATSALLKDAIGNWAAGKRSNTVMGKAALGDLNAATAGSGANEDNALRQAIKQLVRPVNNDIVPKAQRLGFNKEEIAAMNTAARGTMVGNAARYLGKAAPTGIVSLAGGAGAGYGVGGPVGAVLAPTVGYIAKKIGDLSTKKQIAALDSLVRSRSPLAAQVAAQMPQVTAQLPAKSISLLGGLGVTDRILAAQPANAGSR